MSTDVDIPQRTVMSVQIETREKKMQRCIREKQPASEQPLNIFINLSIYLYKPLYLFCILLIFIKV